SMMENDVTLRGWQSDVLHFWFEELTPEDWYTGKPELDDRIRQRFGELPDSLAAGLPPEDEANPKAVLAAIIALDQFPRNMHRGKAEAFANDAQAVELARKAVAAEMDSALSAQERQFLY